MNIETIRIIIEVVDVLSYCGTQTQLGYEYIDERRKEQTRTGKISH